jgi:asparagine synthase (glutamine-hydrolysing)
MSFFGGVFGAPGSDSVDVGDGRIRRALGLDSGSWPWERPGQEILAHSQSPITPEDRGERLPALFDGGRKVLVWDGRLDNREELMCSIRLRGQISTIPDSAIVAGAIERWGHDACRYLLGDFAFACWDIAERRLILATDHTGNRPILYHANSWRIAFATTVSALLACPDVPREIDLTSLARLLTDAPPASGSTMFREVRQVPAASYLVWSAKGITVTRYWSPDFSRRLRYSRDEDYVDQARDLLDASVRCRLRAEGPIACHLSGGFDSSAVAATAARLAAPLPVYSATAVAQEGAPVCPASPRIFVNEWAHASAVAAMHPNLNAQIAPAAPPSEEDPRLLFYYRGMPVRNFMNLSWFGAANRAVRDLGARVLLIGSAGNLTLSWNGRRGLADLAASGRLWTLRRELRGLAREGLGRPWDSVRRDVVPCIAPAALLRARDRFRGSTAPIWKTASAISAELAVAAKVEAIMAESAGRIQRLNYDSSLRIRYFEDMWLRPGNSLLRPYVGFERWDPLADVRLIEFCLAIPPEQYLRNGVTRRLARRALADRVPAQVLRENRKGRQSPDWFHRLSWGRARLAAVVERLRKSPLAGYALDLPRMKTVLDQWPADANAAQRKYGPLMLVLARGANVGEFLEWVENGCAAPPGIPERRFLEDETRERHTACPVL